MSGNPHSLRPFLCGNGRKEDCCGRPSKPLSILFPQIARQGHPVAPQNLKVFFPVLVLLIVCHRTLVPLYCIGGGHYLSSVIFTAGHWSLLVTAGHWSAKKTEDYDTDCAIFVFMFPVVLYERS
jgi:hypothetical protein